MKEMHRVRYGGRVWRSHALSGGATCPESSLVHQPGCSLKPGLLCFMVTSLHSHDWLKHQLLVIDFGFQILSPFQRSNGWDWKSNPLSTQGYSTQPWQPWLDPILRGFPISHLININPVMVKRSLSCMTRHPVHLYVSEAISGTEDNGPNTMTKDAPIALIAQEILTFWGTGSQEYGWRPNIQEKYLLVIWVTKNIFHVHHIFAVLWYNEL